MTQAMINRTIARSTGESLRTIRRVGFGLIRRSQNDLEPEDLQLKIDCPFCGHSCSLPSSDVGLPQLAECDPCDLDFDYLPGDVYAAGSNS